MMQVIKEVLGFVGLARLVDRGLSPQQTAFLNEFESWHEAEEDEYVALLKDDVAVTFSRTLRGLPIAHDEDIFITDVQSFERGCGNLKKAFAAMAAAADKHEIDMLIRVNELTFESQSISGEPDPFGRFGRFLLRKENGFEQTPGESLDFFRHHI